MPAHHDTILLHRYRLYLLVLSTETVGRCYSGAAADGVGDDAAASDWPLLAPPCPGGGEKNSAGVCPGAVRQLPDHVFTTTLSPAGTRVVASSFAPPSAIVPASCPQAAATSPPPLWTIQAQGSGAGSTPVRACEYPRGENWTGAPTCSACA